MGLSPFPSLFLLLSFLFFSPIATTTIVFDVTSPCALQGSCDFLDPQTWQRGFVPSAKDEVFVTSATPLNLFIQNNKSSNVISQITISGNVNFRLINASLSISLIRWGGNSTIAILENSIVSFSRSFGSSLLISGKSVLNVDQIESEVIQVFNSTFYASTVTSSIYASGFSAFLQIVGVSARAIIINDIRQFTAKSVKVSGGIFSMQRCYHIAFEEIILSNATLDYTPPNELYYLMHAGNIFVKDTRATIKLNDYSRFDLGYLVGMADFIFGNGVTLNVAGMLGFWGIQQDTGTYATINAAGNLSFYSNTIFHGTITQIATAIVEVHTFLSIFPLPENFPLQNNCSNGGQWVVDIGAKLFCDSVISADRVDIMPLAAVRAKTIFAKNMKASNATIYGDVEIRGGNYEENDGLQISDYTLYIDGYYWQQSGVIQASLRSSNFTTPLLDVSGSINLFDVSILFSGFGKSLFSKGKKVDIAKSGSAITTSVGHHYLQARDQDGGVYKVIIKDHMISITRTVLELYQILLAIIVSVVAIFITLFYYYRIWRKRLRNQINSEEHELEDLR